MQAAFEAGDGFYSLEDYETALASWKPLAEQGDTRAQYNLGIMCSEGQGVPQDDAEAAKWFRQAAEQGLAVAQFQLAVMYDNGQGVSQDYWEARNWYKKAAAQGMHQAQYNLGAMYECGEGVEQSYEFAFPWYLQVAEQGVPLAQFQVSVMYENGQGVPQDFVQAHKWCNLAAAAMPRGWTGPRAPAYSYQPGETAEQYRERWYLPADAQALTRTTAVEKRDAVAEKMTSEQIAEAQRLAREWKPKIE